MAWGWAWSWRPSFWSAAGGAKRREPFLGPSAARAGEPHLTQRLDAAGQCRAGRNLGAAPKHSGSGRLVRPHVVPGAHRPRVALEVDGKRRLGIGGIDGR